MSMPGVTNDPRFPVPETMKAWVLGDPGHLSFVDKPVPSPGHRSMFRELHGA